MKAVETVKNIWKIEDLRNRILTTLLFVLIYRLGSYIVLPGIDPQSLDALKKSTEGGLLSLLDMFSGGAFSNATIFALGIMPYISASIVVQLLGLVVPYFQKMSQEGESGRKKINQWTRVLTIVILLVQAPTYLGNLDTQLKMSGSSLPGSWGFIVTSTIILTSGSMFVMWLGERITDRGIGNGISLLIMIGIIARLPMAFVMELTKRFGDQGNGGLVLFFVELVLLVIVFGLAILLVQGVRKIPVQYAKRIVGNKQYGGVRQYLPLKVNAAGVMPIIFAQAIMFIPLLFFGMSSSQDSAFARAFFNNNSVWYNIVFALLIIVFTYFYTAMIFRPQQIAEDLKRNEGFIPGVKPGKKTAEYIDDIMSKVTLPSSIFLAFVAIMPAIFSALNMSDQFAQFFGGTSLLILVGVVLDTLSQIEGHLTNRYYDGLMKSGRIKGRAGSVSAY